MGKPRALKKLGAAVIADAMRKASTISEAAKALGVNKGTVSRWVSLGKVQPPGRGPTPAQVAAVEEAKGEAAKVETAEEWATWVRQKFVLTRNEEELVGLAEMALKIAKSTGEGPTARLAAMARFQALLNSLKLEPESKGRGDGQSVASRAAPARKGGGDPRALLMTVN